MLLIEEKPKKSGARRENVSFNSLPDLAKHSMSTFSQNEDFHFGLVFCQQYGHEMLEEWEVIVIVFPCLDFAHVAS